MSAHTSGTAHFPSSQPTPGSLAWWSTVTATPGTGEVPAPISTVRPVRRRATMACSVRTSVLTLVGQQIDKGVTVPAGVGQRVVLSAGLLGELRVAELVAALLDVPAVHG